MPDDLGNRPELDALVPLIDKIDAELRDAAEATAPLRHDVDEALAAKDYETAAALLNRIAEYYVAHGLGGYRVEEYRRRAVDCLSLRDLKPKTKTKKEGEAMTHSELHVAVRDLLRHDGGRFQSFQVSIWSTEHHPNRVSVEYMIHISGLPRDYRSDNPKNLLDWVRMTLKAVVTDDVPPPASLLSIGSPPRLARVK